VSALSYGKTGVRSQEAALGAVARHLGPTLCNAEVLAGLGHYAAVLKLSDGLALALCTDGVGSKTVVASALGRFETIGFDCVAMNVNDLLCVGARPLAMVDYLAVGTLDEGRADAVLRGLGAAASEAGIAIPGGEIAQLPDVIGSGDPAGFDLVGAAVGTLHPDELITGEAVAPGDALVGIWSSGIHANGLTLARRALLDQGGLRLDDHIDPLARTLGAELLEPTAVYIRPVVSLWDAGIATHGLAHITGDGLRNLCRLSPAVGYAIDDLPEPPAVFSLIAELGSISPAEMYAVFNMGIGFVAVVADGDADAAVETIGATGRRARRIGWATEEAGALRLEQLGLVGDRSGLRPV
jgi:phosphoribosylformylglycinamidine cyclo-ligase